MQIICTSIQTDNHTNTSSLNFFTGCMLFLMPDQQCQSTAAPFAFMVHGQVTIIFVVSVCLFVCAEFFSAVFDPISIKLGHML